VRSDQGQTFGRPGADLITTKSMHAVLQVKEVYAAVFPVK
jgi:hypothetical protein